MKDNCVLGFVAASFLLALLMPANPVTAQTSSSDYVAGIQSYFEGNFNTCLRTLDRVVRLVTLTKQESCEARTFMGACHLQLDDSVSARTEFEKAIRLDPEYVIGLDFTPPIRQFYLRLRDRAFITVLIDSDPSGVALSIDGNSVGQTPYKIDSVFVGDTFEISLAPDTCYRSLETTVEAVEGRSNQHMFGLERVPCPSMADQEITDEPRVEPTTSKRPFRFAVVAAASFSSPLGGYLEGYKTGFGRSLDLIVPVSRKFALRLSVAESGLSIIDRQVEWNDDIRGDMGTIALSELFKSDIWGAAISLQYSHWPHRDSGGKTIYSFYAGLGASNLNVRTQDGYYPRLVYDDQNQGLIKFGTSVDFFLTQHLALNTQISSCFLIGHVDRRPFHQFLTGEGGGALLTDFSLGLAIFP